MALSAAEQQELSQLEGDVGHAAPSSSLSHGEQAELSGLEKEVGHVATSGSKSSHEKESWLDARLPFGTTPRGLIKGASGALPTAGMIAGGMAAAPANIVAPGVAEVGGAGLGYAAGKEAEDFINNRVLGETPQSSEPTEAAKRVIGNTASGAAYDMGGKLIGKGIGAIAESAPGKYVIGKAGKAASTVASGLSGIPQQELETYAANPSAINKIAKDANYNSQTMADTLRSEINDKIQASKSALNGQISKAFESRAGDTVNADPIVKALNDSKAQINASLRPEEIEQVDHMLSKVDAVNKNGQIGLKDAHDLKEWLSEQAKNSYAKNGQIFQNGTKAQAAAKAGSSAARSLVNEASPEIASANGTLSKLHDLEDVMNRNLLSEGKTGASLYSAGSGANEANEAALKEIDDITGANSLKGAQKIAAAKTFGKAPLLPVDSTGKTATRVGAAAAAGYMLGGPAGAAAMEGFASPLGIKAAINAGELGGRAGSAIAKNAPSVIGSGAFNAANAMRATNGEAPQEMKSPDLTPAKSQPSPPLKGPVAWANDGLNKLIAHSGDQSLADQKEAFLSSPKAKNLLITASDLKPGSKAMEQILSKLKSQLAEEK